MSASSATAPSSTTADVDVIDLDAWRAGGAGAPAAAAAAAASLRSLGLLLVRDSRASAADNDSFLDMMEAYFSQPAAAVAADERPALSFQVGSTPSHQELPRDHCARMRALATADAPLSLCPPEKDAKQRFFWRLGARPAATAYAELNAPPVTPAAFPQWAETMDKWGGKLLAALADVAELAAVGFGLPRDAFAAAMREAPHLLAPTASDLARFGAPGTVLAGYHYDLNFLTIHGRSRFPGLYVWSREGRRLAVAVPPGCLLVQAGKQMEILTGGAVQAGFHEVVVAPATTAAIEAARAAGRPLWRISSTCFGHIASDVLLRPLGVFAELPGAAEAYPPVLAGDQVAAELRALNLAAPAATA